MVPPPLRLAPVVWTSLLLLGCPADTPATTSASDTASGETGPPETSGSGALTTGECPVGGEGCPCTGGGGCDGGLMCNADRLCEVEPGVSSGADTTIVDPSSTTTGGDTTTADESTSTSTGETLGPECTPTGEKTESAECLGKDPMRPFCVADTCVPCQSLVDLDFNCADATGGDRPLCHDDGTCVQCNAVDAVLEEQCGPATPHCNLDSHMCEGCFEHSECPETACDIEARKCFPKDKILYVRKGPVQPNDCSGTPGSGGTKVKPYCDLDTAILAAQINGYTTGWTFYVLASEDESDHGSVSLGPPEGPDADVSYAFVHEMGGLLDKHTRLKGLGPMITIPKRFTLYLKDFGVLIANEAFSDSSVGIECQPGGSVWLDDSRVLYARGPGIRANGCEIHMRRSAVAFGYTEGIDMRGGSLHAVNSFISKNAWIKDRNGGGLRLRPDDKGAPAVDILYSTLVGNSNEPIQATHGDTITCEGAATVKIRNSILGRKPGTGNVGVTCPDADVTIITSVTDADDNIGGNKKLAAEDIITNLSIAQLTGQYKIPSQASAMFFAEAAQWEIGDPHFDVDGEERSNVAGSFDFAGADVFPLP